MARQRNPCRDEAKRMWLEAEPGTIKLKDIAAALGKPENTIRKWKSEDKWETERSDTEKRNAPKKRGGQPGNKNAVGNNGGAPAGNTNALKHGGYSQIFWDTLDDEEKELINTMEKDPEQMLLDEISLLTVRERRILKSIKKFGEMKGGLAVASVIRSEDKRSFKNPDEEQLYLDKIEEQVMKGDRLPGSRYHVTTNTEATYDIVHRLEEALSRCQDQKRRAIESLTRLYAESGKLTGSSASDDWVAAVLAAEGMEDEADGEEQ